MDESQRPNPSQPEDKETQEWQDLLSTVEVSEIPVELIKVLRIHLDNGQKVVLPIRQWIDDGYPVRKIEAVVNQYFEENDQEIESNDIVVDFDKLKTVISAETKKTLKL